MNIVVLGGTQFVGRAIVDQLLTNDHQVTLFHRGKTNPGLFPTCKHILGDRVADIEKAKETHWDAVLDVSGYLPSQLVASAQLKTDFYAFISTISIYDTEGIEGPFDEQTRQFAEGDMEATEVTGANYGPLKVTCERIVREAFPNNHAMIRPGIIIGPHDHTGRFPYWVARLDQFDEVLVPNTFEERFQGIDARDLAAFTVSITEQKQTGFWNAVGPRVSFGEVLDEIRRQTQREHNLVVASIEDLEKVDVKLWQDLPVTLPPDSQTFNYDPAKAQSVGLNLRPIAETIADTLAWIRAEGIDGLGKYGMTRDREVEAILRLKSLAS